MTDTSIKSSSSVSDSTMAESLVPTTTSELVNGVTQNSNITPAKIAMLAAFCVVLVGCVWVAYRHSRQDSS